MSTGPVTPGPINPGPPPKSGSNVLMIILIIGAVVLLGCGGICAGAAWFASVAVRDASDSFKEFGDTLAGMILLTPVMDQAATTVLNDEQVGLKLGNPIERTSEPERDNTGELDPVHESFHFNISGPNGTAKVMAHATQVEATWRLTQITVEFSDGEKVEVSPPAEPPNELNFDMEMSEEGDEN
jgi:hypothetical protein